jgi:hypothetical protein
MTDQEFEDAFLKLHNYREVTKGMTLTVWFVLDAVLKRLVVRDRNGHAHWPAHNEIVEFLDSLDSRQRRLLKEVAEELLLNEDLDE